MTGSATEVTRGEAWTGTVSDFSLPERSLLSSESTRKRLPGGRPLAASAASELPAATGGSGSPRSAPCSAGTRQRRRTAQWPLDVPPAPPSSALGRCAQSVQPLASVVKGSAVDVRLAGSALAGVVLAAAGQVPLELPPQRFVAVAPPALAGLGLGLGDRVLGQARILRVGGADLHVGVPHHPAVGVHGRLGNHEVPVRQLDDEHRAPL